MTRITKIGLVVFISIIFLTGCHKQRGPKRAEPVELLGVEELYQKGEALVKKHRTQTARKYFEQITLREDAGEYKEKAEVAIADSYFAEKNVEAYAEAISRYQSFLAFHSMHPLAPYCQYKIGLCYFREIDRPDRDISPARNAKEIFKRLIENYPNSEYVADAKEKLNEVNNILAAHEIYIGDFYLESSHPKAARARYEIVVKEYPDYWNIPLVYFRIAEACLMDKNFEEARIYLEKVIQSAPDSHRAKEGWGGGGSVEKREIK
ncbi:MAG: outer membrane protein assembly factor BamD, partial [Acidobacteria bacterium]|nr:outer membrane protein assembly factor BamD [Acidobacteriota bacterium]